MVLGVTIQPFDSSKDDNKYSFSVIGLKVAQKVDNVSGTAKNKIRLSEALKTAEENPNILFQSLENIDAGSLRKYTSLDLDDKTEYSLVGEIANSNDRLNFMYSGISAFDHLTIIEKERGRFFASMSHMNDDDRGDCIVTCPSSGESAPGCLECKVGDLWIEVCC